MQFNTLRFRIWVAIPIRVAGDNDKRATIKYESMVLHSS